MKVFFELNIKKVKLKVMKLKNHICYNLYFTFLKVDDYALKGPNNYGFQF